MSNSSTIVQRVWNYCNVLRDDGVSYGDYLEVCGRVWAAVPNPARYLNSTSATAF
jgi:hypothetical protein